MNKAKHKHDWRVDKVTKFAFCPVCLNCIIGGKEMTYKEYKVYIKTKEIKPITKPNEK